MRWKCIDGIRRPIDACKCVYKMFHKQDFNKTSSKKPNKTDHKMSVDKHSPNTSAVAGIPTRTYQDDKDFDEAFKNLLRPIESITKKTHCEPLQYNLLKELDSYLNHLKETSDSGSSVFVEAALMIQNVILLYQKRVDQIVEDIINLVAKFRAYRRNQSDNNTVDDVENVGGNKKKKKEKKIKLYPSFDEIEGQFGQSKTFDCKLINLSKKPPTLKIVLNANIKVDNKYSKLLPYIMVGNGENIGKKYDFMVNCSLNRDLAVKEEFDCLTNNDYKNHIPLRYQNNHNPLPITMDVDEVNNEDVLPSTPDPVIFDQTVGEYNPILHAAVPNSECVVNTSQIPPITDDDAWACAVDNNAFPDKPIINKKFTKKPDNSAWLPSYTMSELCLQLVKLKSDIATDSMFRKIIYHAREAQRSEIAKKRIEQAKADGKKQFDFDEEMKENLLIDDEPGFRGFDNNDADYNFNENFVDQELPTEENAENFETYQKNSLDMQKHEQNQMEIMDEQLEMRKRVQVWHDNLRPILELEEKRNEFDIHEYGTEVLDCFENIGEKKSLKDLVGGLEEEEISRFFLSTLMMTNTYNVELVNGTGELDGELQIELLKKERHHEQLQVNIGNQVNQEPK